MGAPHIPQVIHAHDNLQRLMMDAATASTSLAIDPNSRAARAQWQVGLRFVRAAVVHMREEEAGAFVDAERAGVPGETLDLLRREHAYLRLLAAELLIRAAPDDEGALLLVRFLHRFDRHVADEEFGLAS